MFQARVVAVVNVKSTECIVNQFHIAIVDFELRYKRRRVLICLKKVNVMSSTCLMQPTKKPRSLRLAGSKLSFEIPPGGNNGRLSGNYNQLWVIDERVSVILGMIKRVDVKVGGKPF